MEIFTSTETIVAMLTRNDVRRYVDNCTTHVSKAHSRMTTLYFYKLIGGRI